MEVGLHVAVFPCWPFPGAPKATEVRRFERGGL
jgi:hypothetical protein